MKKKILKITLVIVLIIAALIGGYAIYGSYKINQLSDMIFEDMLAYTTKDNENAVITVGIIQNDKMVYEVYGENGMKISQEEHIYEIGSITKTFTTSLLCKAIVEGKIKLDNHIDEYLSLKEKDYYPTIRRLVTHTSGYKNYYFEKPMMSNFIHGENDYNGISQAMILKRLIKLI